MEYFELLKSKSDIRSKGKPGNKCLYYLLVLILMFQGADDQGGIIKLPGHTYDGGIQEYMALRSSFT